MGSALKTYFSHYVLFQLHIPQRKPATDYLYFFFYSQSKPQPISDMYYNFKNRGSLIYDPKTNRTHNHKQKTTKIRKSQQQKDPVPKITKQPFKPFHTHSFSITFQSILSPNIQTPRSSCIPSSNFPPSL